MLPYRFCLTSGVLHHSELKSFYIHKRCVRVSTEFSIFTFVFGQNEYYDLSSMCRPRYRQIFILQHLILITSL